MNCNGKHTAPPGGGAATWQVAVAGSAAVAVFSSPAGRRVCRVMPTPSTGYSLAPADCSSRGAP